MTEIDETELLLAQVAADIIESVSMARAMELAAGLGAPERVMGPREHEVARHANPDYAKLRGIPPLDPAAGKWCSYCGNPEESELVPGPDHEHGFNDWMCRDELDRHCQARHERRWPPMPGRAEPVFMKLARQADEAQAARHQQEPAGQQEPAQQQQEPVYQPPGWQMPTVNGAYDANGTWHPPISYTQPPAWQLSHVISGGASMSHAISGGAQHMGHTISGIARGHAQGQQGAYGAQDGQQAQYEPQQQGTEIPPERLTRGQAEALYDGHGGDIAMQPHPDPAAAPQRPPRDRYGRRRPLRYRGR